MNITDIRADIIEVLCEFAQATIESASESADSDNVILVTDADGNRYKLTIEKL
jgi:hypothetical protein